MTLVFPQPDDRSITVTKTTPTPRRRANPQSVPATASAPASASDSVSAAFPGPMGPMGPEDWAKLQMKLDSVASKRPIEGVFSSSIFGADTARQACYLYGLSTSLDHAVTNSDARTNSDTDENQSHAGSETLAWLGTLARLATSPTDQTVPPSDQEQIRHHATLWLTSAPDGHADLATALEAVLWASAMVRLTRILPQEKWWQLLSHLQQYRAEAALGAESRSAGYLLLAGELGITLAWRLSGLPSCSRTVEASLDAVASFIEGEADSIDCVLQQPGNLRCVVASLLRCECLFPVVSQRKFKKRHREIAAELATWMAAMLRHDGSQALTPGAGTKTEDGKALPFRKALKLDTQGLRRDKQAKTKGAKKTKKANKRANHSRQLLSGLMHAASDFDAQTLVPAIAASLGQSHSGGRLAWEVSLPEAMWHSEESKIVAMLPEWDVRRGRTFIDYSGEDMRIEVVGGRSVVLSGIHQTLVQVNGNVAEPKGPWEVNCEYTDDDVHMIEMEQPFTLGVVLQRQWMVIREDRCVMVSDAVLPSTELTPDHSSTSHPGGSHGSPPDGLPDGLPFDAPELTCVSRLPIADGIDWIEDEETREVLLSSKSKNRCKVLPLAASEWRVGPSDCQISVSDDRHLIVEMKGTGAIYSPIWLDFQTRRFRRPSTWRSLTIAENLNLLSKNVAAGFRIQSGSEHWVVYRSLSGRSPRSFMGKHMIADFFAARFHPGDGGMEELVTVDENGSQ